MVNFVMHIVPHLEKYYMINSYKTSEACTHLYTHDARRLATCHV